MLKPLPAAKWNYTTAAHLLNRAGFGGTPVEVEKIRKLGPEKAVDFFVDYETLSDPLPSPAWAKAGEGPMGAMEVMRDLGKRTREAKTDEERKAIDAERRKKVQEEQRREIQRILELRGWWLEAMANSPRPLQEKLTLFWHGHFATSAVKVRNGYFMYLQNDTFRKHASGNWLEMLTAVAKDPAMLLWLDQAQSRKEHPNENFAREVMELFALGEGHYTEKDVTEAARAMTGFSIDRITQEFTYRPFFHDNGSKTVLGKNGNFDGNDFLKIIVDEPQAARFISWKLWKFFASEEAPAGLVDAMAESFRAKGNNFKPLLKQMFRSQEFYADSVIRSQVKSPTQWLVNTVKLLQRDLPPALVLSQLMRNLGQELFAPPNVKGWDGGLSWITTNNLLARYNEAAMLVFAKGEIPPDAQKPGFRMAQERANNLLNRMPQVDVAKILSPEQRNKKALLIPALEKHFLAGQLKEKQRKVLTNYLESRGELDDEDIRHAIRLLMSTPEYQLT
ncbi:MAG: hypothetical protein JWM68_3372 [Verrucomicrobiales bacterium]|nr:hypothetical protein [Verrucomicrobiales bacterium]